MQNNDKKSLIETIAKFNQTRFDTSRFISFEGIEGSGKSTQIQLLKSNLENQGKTVLLLREPGGTKFGESLRSSILESDVKIAPIAEAYLFAASRAQLLQEKILPALADKDTYIIIDRYIDSSFAYQGCARGLGIETILNIHLPCPLNILPGKTIYLEIDIETSFARQKERGDEKDYFEKEDQSFYQSLIDGFSLSAKLFTKRIKTIDGNQSLERVHSSILSGLGIDKQ